MPVVGVCFLCNLGSDDCEGNIDRLKSQHSETPIVEIIKKFYRDLTPRRIIADETNFICVECIIRINEYDFACETVQRIENDFHNLLVKGETIWKRFMAVSKPTKIVDKYLIEKMKLKIKDNHVDYYNNSFIFDEDQATRSNQDLKLTCRKCNLTFASLTELASHDHDDNTVAGNPRGDYKCRTCKNTFNKKVEFIKHVRLHKQESKRKLKCDNCMLVLKDEEAYDDHCKLHANQTDKCACVICNKVLANKASLVKHTLIHSSDTDKKIICHRCGKVFFFHTSFKGHMKAHDDIRTSKCSICNMQFRSISHLNRHKRSHTKEKMFVCSKLGCGKKFAYSDNRNAHEKQHCGEGGSEVSDKVHICFCGAAYSRKSKLKEHLEKSHGTMEPHAYIANELDDNDVRGRSLGDSV